MPSFKDHRAKITLITFLLGLMISASCFGQIARRALFLGNSYTYVNNLPQLIADIADGLGDSLIFDSNTPGGYTLDNHFSDITSQNKIKAGNWDYLILQEQSQLPSFQYYVSNGPWNLSALQWAYSPCGRVMYYMTWGRENGDATNCAAWPPVCTYIGMDTLLRRRYIEMAELTSAEISPVGAAWRYVRQNYPSINLYQSDGSHPSVAGSYLAACCFYAAIFKKNPLLINYNYVLTTGEANSIKQAAKLVVYDSLASWSYVVNTPTVNFNYTIGSGNNQVIFSNGSLLTDSYQWNFGDASSSTLKNPTHSYLNNGIYTITLTGYNCDIDTTYQASHQMTVSFCPFTPSVSPTNLTVCPNIPDTLWTQVYNSYQWFDMNGNPIPNATQQFFVPVGGNSYYVQASQNGCSEKSVPVYVNVYGNTSIYQLIAYGNLVGQDTACLGETLTLVLAPTKPPFPDKDQWIDWTINGQPVPGYHNDTLVVTSSGLYGAMLHHEFCPGLNIFNQQMNYTFIECNTGVVAREKKISVQVYPNPFEQVITVQITDEFRGSAYTIIDVTGNIVQSGKLERQKNELDTGTLPKGVYLLRVLADEARSARFIKR